MTLWLWYLLLGEHGLHTLVNRRLYLCSMYWHLTQTFFDTLLYTALPLHLPIQPILYMYKYWPSSCPALPFTADCLYAAGSAGSHRIAGKCRQLQQLSWVRCCKIQVFKALLLSYKNGMASRVPQGPLFGMTFSSLYHIPRSPSLLFVWQCQRCYSTWLFFCPTRLLPASFTAFSQGHTPTGNQLFFYR